MRESQGQNRRGTPTGERALQGARLPQGKQVDPRLSAFCFLFYFSVRSFVRAPPLNHDQSGSPHRIDLTKAGCGVVLWNGVPHGSDAQKIAPRERERLSFISPHRGSAGAPYAPYSANLR
jgi:hypothetical protein